MPDENPESAQIIDDPHVRNALDYLTTYNQTLRRLFGLLPIESRNNLLRFPNPHLATGPLWIAVCANGVVARIRNGFSVAENELTVDDARNGTMLQYFDSVADQLSYFLEPISKLRWDGHRWPYFQDGPVYDLMLTKIIVGGPPGLVYFPSASVVFLIGCKCFDIDPKIKAEKAATESLNDAHGLANLHSVSAASKLLKSYRELLDRDTSEAELQTFLEAHPELIYPEYEIVRPQPNLGGERQPDFAFSMRSAFGSRWIFVEIERPNKPIFTKGSEFQFAHEFTQAKGQLLQWDHLITKGHAFIAERFEGLVKPEFHLIYGRDAELDRNRRGMLGAEFSAASNRMFSTFDDLANRFETIANRVFAAKI